MFSFVSAKNNYGDGSYKISEMTWPTCHPECNETGAPVVIERMGECCVSGHTHTLSILQDPGGIALHRRKVEAPGAPSNSISQCRGTEGAGYYEIYRGGVRRCVRLAWWRCQFTVLSILSWRRHRTGRIIVFWCQPSPGIPERPSTQVVGTRRIASTRWPSRPLAGDLRNA